ncbi:hypothetical protein BX666DRAFT_1990376 [Dichotomocladium elegans]|nr:hypothetical protein BX666DRAFT_1990376 [Dichotomocladium elegans]
MLLFFSLSLTFSSNFLMAIAGLNAGFAAFGRQCASQRYLVCLLSLILFTFLSWPTILDLNNQAKYSLTSAISTYDYFWQHSPYVQPFNLNASLDNITHIAYQIQFFQQADKAPTAGSERLPVDQTLLARARAWQHAFTAQPVELVDDQNRKKSIALNRVPSFTLISPFDHYWLPDEPIPVNWSSFINPHHLDPLTVFRNVTLDKHGQFLSADAIIMTALIPRDIESIWSKALEQQKQTHQLSWHVRQMREPIQRSWQYRHRNRRDLTMVSLPSVSTSAYLFIALHLLMFYIVSATFSRSPLISSPNVLGMACVFVSIACLATTLTVLDHFDVTIDAVPWYLLSLVPVVASAENQLLLANAVVHAGCDMSVREKAGRGFQSVGVPMLGALVAELIILEIGRAIQSATIQQFCKFAQTALIIEYILEMTLFAAILSIDINHAQLADLDDRHVSKRLRELAKHTSQQHSESSINNLNFCPVQDVSPKEFPHAGGRGIPCSGCKNFKTHRAVNALMLCVVILSISLVQTLSSSPNSQATITFGICNVTNEAPKWTAPNAHLVTERLEAASAQYWELTNPNHETRWIHVKPPILLVSYAKAPDSPIPLRLSENRVHEEQQRTKVYYHHRHQRSGKPSRIRMFAIACVQQVLALLWNINFPLCTMLVIFVGMVTWLYTSYQNQSLLVLLIKMLETEKTSPVYHRLAKFTFSSIAATSSLEPSQSERDEQKASGTTNHLSIKTLSGQHFADIHRFDVNQEHHLAVSCGYDDQMVIWNTESGKPVYRIESTSSVKHVRIDRHGDWIANVTSDGVARVWCARRKQTIPIQTFKCEVERDTSISLSVATRRQPQKQPGSSLQSSRDGPIIDRIQDIRFIGVAQRHLVTVHKSGAIREWDILTGECIYTIASEHGHGTTIMHVMESKHTPPLRTAMSWMFLASKDGRISCWKRQHPADWECSYSISSAHGVGNHITALAAEATIQPKNSAIGLLVSGASDGSIKAWNFETGRPVCILQDSNAAATVTKLAITRYCESLIDNDQGISCEYSYDPSSISGYLVAAYSLMKNRVGVWKVNYTRADHCRNAAYYPVQHKRQKPKGSNNYPTAASASIMRQTVVRNDGSLQDGNKGQRELIITFLGTIVQYGGRGIAFCVSGNNQRLMLTGIRMNRSTCQWEVWSTTSLLHQQGAGKSAIIPVDTLTIDHTHDGSGEGSDGEASELLPFSAVRHVLPLTDNQWNPNGFACDFGNFIKIIDAPKRAAIRLQPTITALYKAQSSDHSISSACSKPSGCCTALSSI